MSFFNRFSKRTLLTAGTALFVAGTAASYSFNQQYQISTCPNYKNTVYADTNRADLPNFPRMTRQEILSILSKNEATFNIDSSDSIISSVKTNQYAANSPIEDYQIFSPLDKRSSFLTVFDGHGGKGTAEWLSENMIPVWKCGLFEVREKVKQLEAYYQIKNLKEDIDSVKDLPKEKKQEIKDCIRHQVVFPDLLKMTYNFLDQMLYQRAIDTRDAKKFGPGSCAVSAYTLDDSMYIANLGDCRAVMGRKNWWTGKWEAIPLTEDQTAVSETERLRKEHPEDPNVVTKGRIKGILQPSRSFGDFMLKVRGILSPEYERAYAPWNPPYVTPIPEVSRVDLSPRKGDRFVVFATDGLWDALTNEEVVQIVGENMERRSTSDSEEDHICTTLISKALQNNAMKDNVQPPLSEEENLSIVLTCPDQWKRNLHDDITISVAYLRPEYRTNSSLKDILPDIERVHYPEEIERLMRINQMESLKSKELNSKL